MPELSVLKVAGSQALAEVERLRAEFPETGRYPVLLGDDDDVDGIEESLDDDRTTSAILDGSTRIEPRRWFAERDEEYMGDVTISDIGLVLRTAMRSARRRLTAVFQQNTWPSDMVPATEAIGIVTHLDGQKPKSEVMIGLFAVDHPWQVFAHLKWGGWNACPYPEEHCALHRYWETLYGAQVVSITSDVVQCWVERPPMNRAASISLAHEQYLYCADIVDQGTQSDIVLAATLNGANYWYFWWD